MSRDATSVINNFAKFELYITYCSRVMMITFCYWPPVPIFTFLGSKGGQISNVIFLTPKTDYLARTTYINDVLSAGVRPRMPHVAVAKKAKKDRNFHASNWLLAQTTHVDIAPWNFACGVVSRI